jgi:archaemetzincin
MVRICLMGVGDISSSTVAALGYAVAEILPCEPRVDRRRLNPQFALDPHRQQYWSTPILEHLEEMRPPDCDRILGVAEVDLCIPILTFVFGEALLERPPALISLHRLRPAFYGLPDDPEQTLDRATRESVHELGHTWGLVHCQEYACVMHVSRVADEIDLKGPGFCITCTATLAENGYAIR